MRELVEEIQRSGYGWSVDWIPSAKKHYATITVEGRVVACAWGEDYEDAIRRAWCQLNATEV